MAQETPHHQPTFTEAQKEAIYAVIRRRRDIRRFRSDPISAHTLADILRAAHLGPSVGFMQPWNFLLISDITTKRRVHELFARENALAAQVFDNERRATYAQLKLAGILDAPLNICVTCDPTRGGPHVLGRHTIRETDVYSTAAAVENLWLAARAEDVGVGWVSILNNDDLKAILGLPLHIIPVAYLCLGYVDAFGDEPELQRVGWARRLPLADLVFYEHWGQHDHPQWEELPQIIADADE